MSLKTWGSVEIVEVKSMGGHPLEVLFGDGHVVVVDFGTFLRLALNPETLQFLNVKRFRQFSLVHGNLVWGEHGVCYSIEDLYEGRIERERQHEKTLAVAETRGEYVTKTERKRAR